jgi:hypothetical protein
MVIYQGSSYQHLTNLRFELPPPDSQFYVISTKCYFPYCTFMGHRIPKVEYCKQKICLWVSLLSFPGHVNRALLTTSPIFHWPSLTDGQRSPNSLSVTWAMNFGMSSFGARGNPDFPDAVSVRTQSRWCLLGKCSILPYHVCDIRIQQCQKSYMLPRVCYFTPFPPTETQYKL